MFSKKYLIKKILLRFLLGKKKMVIYASRLKKSTKNISRQLTLVTNQKFSHFIPAFYR